MSEPGANRRRHSRRNNQPARLKPLLAITVVLLVITPIAWIFFGGSIGIPSGDDSVPYVTLDDDRYISTDDHEEPIADSTLAPADLPSEAGTPTPTPSASPTTTPSGTPTPGRLSTDGPTPTDEPTDVPTTGRADGPGDAASVDQHDPDQPGRARPPTTKPTRTESPSPKPPRPTPTDDGNMDRRRARSCSTSSTTSAAPTVARHSSAVPLSATAPERMRSAGPTNNDLNGGGSSYVGESAAGTRSGLRTDDEYGTPARSATAISPRSASAAGPPGTARAARALIRLRQLDGPRRLGGGLPVSANDPRCCLSRGLPRG